MHENAEHSPEALHHHHMRLSRGVSARCMALRTRPQLKPCGACAPLRFNHKVAKATIVAARFNHKVSKATIVAAGEKEGPEGKYQTYYPILASSAPCFGGRERETRSTSLDSGRGEAGDENVGGAHMQAQGRLQKWCRQIRVLSLRQPFRLVQSRFI